VIHATHSLEEACSNLLESETMSADIPLLFLEKNWKNGTFFTAEERKASKSSSFIDALRE
jgi:hypothetical protein